MTEVAKIEEERIQEIVMKILEELLFGERPWEEVCKEAGLRPDEFDYYQDKLFTEKNETDFNPIEDDPSDMMKAVYNFLRNVATSDDDPGPLFNKQTLGAWDFFKDTIGIDYSKIFGRWKNAPELFISTHMSSRNIIPLIELYNEAARTYIFGLTEASVAMCRALMEHVLEKYYLCSGDDLGKIISEAERRYKHLRGLNLHSKRKLANKVLHDYENRGKDIEKAALDFLLTIRYLVTKTPSPE